MSTLKKVTYAAVAAVSLLTAAVQAAADPAELPGVVSVVGR